MAQTRSRFMPVCFLMSLNSSLIKTELKIIIIIINQQQSVYFQYVKKIDFLSPWKWQGPMGFMWHPAMHFPGFLCWSNSFFLSPWCWSRWNWMLILIGSMVTIVSISPNHSLNDGIKSESVNQIFVVHQPNQLNLISSTFAMNRCPLLKWSNVKVNTKYHTKWTALT